MREDGSPRKHEFPIKFNTKRERILKLYIAVLDDRTKRKIQKKIKSREGKGKDRNRERADYRQLILFLGLPGLKHY